MKKHTLQDYFKTSFQADLSSALVVFLVAIPLCLGIALASEAPMMSGIIAGLVGGIMVGIFGGSELGVSGPAAGLVAVVIGAAVALGSFEALLLATMLAGVIQLGLGLLKAGAVAYYIPTAVIKGMLAAIGLIIILKQIPHAVGYDAAPEGELALNSADGHTTFSDLAYMISGIQPGALIITLVCLAVLIGWSLPFLKKYRFFSIIPGPLAAVLLGIGLNQLFMSVAPNLAIGSEHLVSLPVDSSPAELLMYPDFSQILKPNIWLYAVIIALVASVESLLCAEATDKLDPQKRLTDMNKELRGQGIANIISGGIGGLPITQVIVRSSANVQSGAKTRGSAIMHGILILLSILAFPVLMNMIPLASLAAVLLMVGYKLMRPSLFKAVYKKGWSQFIPFLVTIVAIMLTDLLVGIGIGMVVAIFFILRDNFRLPFLYNYKEEDDRHHVQMELSEMVSFLNKAQILSTLQSIPEDSVVEIDGRRTKFIHPDVVEVLEDFLENAKHRNIQVKIEGLHDDLAIGSAKELQRKLQSPRSGGGSAGANKPAEPVAHHN